MNLINQTTNEYGSTPGPVKRMLLRWVARDAHVSTWYLGVLTPGGCSFFNPDNLNEAQRVSKTWGSPVKKFIEIP